MPGIRCSLLVLCSSLLVLSRAEFEDLSDREIEDLLHTLDYMEHKRDSDAPLSHYDEDYYQDDIFANADTEPLSNNLRQVETMSHGSPFSPSASGPVAHHSNAAGHAPGGTTKASPKNAGAVLPAYCDPPNPCPLGYTTKDGCLEEFENTSEFSRRYQAGQNCLCDSEHMFNCPMEEQDPTRTQNEPFLAGMPPSLTSELESGNPYLSGHKLPVAAKKGLGF